MKKSDLTAVLATSRGMSQKDAEIIVDLVFSCMALALRNGERVEIRGFGTFHTRMHGQYTGRNPRTGEPVEVQAKRMPVFKVGKDLRERIGDRHPAAKAPTGKARAKAGPRSARRSEAVKAKAKAVMAAAPAEAAVASAGKAGARKAK